MHYLYAYKNIQEYCFSGRDHDIEMILCQALSNPDIES